MLPSSVSSITCGSNPAGMFVGVDDFLEFLRSFFSS